MSIYYFVKQNTGLRKNKTCYSFFISVFSLRNFIPSFLYRIIRTSINFQKYENRGINKLVQFHIFKRIFS